MRTPSCTRLATILRLFLATLLSAHLGFSQVMAAPVGEHGAAAAIEVTAEPAAADEPCHGVADHAPASDEQPSPASHSCCDPGSCHCAMASGLPASLIATAAPDIDQVNVIVPGPMHTRFPKPDFRPPIS